MLKFKIIASIFLIKILIFPIYAYNQPSTIYCRDAFAKTWGQQLNQHFGDQIKIIVLSGHGMLSRLRLELRHTSADLLIGLDTTQINELQALQLIADFPYALEENFLPVPWPQTPLIPVAYGVMGILTHSLHHQKVIKNLDDLTNSSVQLIIPDPRTSTTGLEFLYWVHHIHGHNSLNYLRQLKNNVKTWPNSLSNSFGIFTASSQLTTIAYTTSAYFAKHRHHKKGNYYNGHGKCADFIVLNLNDAPIQVYGVAVTLKGKSHSLTSQVIQYLRSPQLQQLIPSQDFLYPVCHQNLSQFSTYLPPLPSHLLSPPFLTNDDKNALIQQWLKAFSVP